MDPRVVVAMPSNRGVPCETVSSFTDLCMRGVAAGYVGAKIVLGDTYIDAARNLLVTYAMDILGEHPATHVFWFDDDMVMPSDTIERLLAHDVPVAGGLYHQRLDPFLPVAYNFVPNTRAAEFIILPDQVPTEGTVEVDGLGLGCTLVRMDVYTRMYEHYEDARWHQVNTGRGEDLHFFDQWQRMGGERPLLDLGVRAGHVRREVVGTVHWEAGRKAAALASAQDEAAAATI